MGHNDADDFNSAASSQLLEEPFEVRMDRVNRDAQVFGDLAFPLVVEDGLGNLQLPIT